MGRRNIRVDNVKGILILLVVIGHFFLPLESGGSRAFVSLFYLIYSFHMPCFVFLSGYLSKSVIKKGSFRWEKPLSLLWLYVIFKCIVYFSEIPAYGPPAGAFPDFLHESGAPWYLMALLLWYLGIPFAAGVKTAWGKAALLLGISLASLAGGYLDMLHPLGDFLSLDRVVAFAPFFYGGYLLSEEGFRRLFPQKLVEEQIIDKKVEEKAETRGKEDAALVNESVKHKTEALIRWSRRSMGNLLIIALCFFLLFHFYELLSPYRYTVYGVWYSRYAETVKENVAMWWSFRLRWYLLAAALSWLLIVRAGDKRSIFTRLGERSLSVYIWHRPIRDILLSAGFLHKFDTGNFWHVLGLMLFSLGITVLLSNSLLYRLMSLVQSLPQYIIGRRK